MSKAIKIGNKFVGLDHKPFVVAEMSGNHGHDPKRALEIVDAAADCGVDAIKIQTYTADTMTLNLKHGEFVIQDKKSLWNNRSLYDLYAEAHLPWEWHEPIFKRCQERGVMGFSTPFDESAVDFLEDLKVPFYKIASFEVTDHPLIRKVARTKKPMVISTGMATEAEIAETVRVAREAGCEDLILLKCTSTYPASPENTNTRTIPYMREKFACEIGLSDHTMGVGVSVAAIAQGATFIEKHFTLRRSDGGVDSAFSMEPEEMKSLVVESERAWQSLGKIFLGPTKAEEASLQFRRSLYVSHDIKKGEKLTLQNIRAIRPGHGLPPKHLEEVLGAIAKEDLKMGQALKWDLIEKKA